ncbi:hypothetical protein CAEBREN_03168 [Caenorhabditis brenneri]|uniref:Zinc finger PHD-type domain-containing protein n=1 Tax=Caenorhabditis brenneri TaxID=135651 RepID=G0MW64_CAEBE|nr:hypothetical protein CAEBREN_03168 [Caenorhabditis brenneri]
MDVEEEPPPGSPLPHLDEQLSTPLKPDAKVVHQNLEDYIKFLKGIELFNHSFEWLVRLIQQNDPVVDPTVPLSSDFMQFFCQLVNENPLQVFAPKEPVTFRDARMTSAWSVSGRQPNIPVGAAKRKLGQPMKIEQDYDMEIKIEDDVPLPATASANCEKLSLLAKLFEENKYIPDKKRGRPRKNKELQEEKDKEEKKNKCGVAGKFCLCSRWEKKDGIVLEWVVCDKCEQWFHTFCIRLNNYQFSEHETFTCCGSSQTPEARNCLNGNIFNLYRSFSYSKRPTILKPYLGLSVMTSSTEGTSSTAESTVSSMSPLDQEPSTSSA